MVKPVFAYYAARGQTAQAERLRAIIAAGRLRAGPMITAYGANLTPVTAPELFTTDADKTPWIPIASNNNPNPDAVLIHENNDGDHAQNEAAEKEYLAHIKKPAILYSILSAEDDALEKEVRAAQWAGVDAIHVDYLDGLLTPDSMAFDCTGQIRRIASIDIPMQVHCMSYEPDMVLIEKLIGAGLKPGRDAVLIHYEAFRTTDALRNIVARIKENGLQVGLVINPNTPLTVLDGFTDILGKGIDSITVMAIVPGAGRRPYIPGTSQKVAALRRLLREKNLSHVTIQTDGGINPSTVERLVTSGISAFVTRTWLLEPKGGLQEKVARVGGMSRRAFGEHLAVMQMLAQYGLDVSGEMVERVIDFCNGINAFTADEITTSLRSLAGGRDVLINKERVVDVLFERRLLRFHKKEIIPIEHMGLQDRAYVRHIAVKVYEGAALPGGQAGYILGISGSWHDATAVLFKDGKMISAVEEERISRTKHDTSPFPVHATHRLLREEGITLKDISHIAIGWNFNIYVDTPHSPAPNDEFFRAMDEAFASRKGVSPESLIRRNVPEKNKARFSIGNLEAFLNELGDYYDTSYRPRVSFVRHHLAHAASAYYPCGFAEDVLTVTLDGYGDTETGTIWIGKDGELDEVARFELPNSLGWVWAAMTEYLGFRPTFAEGEVMGFAPYGMPRDAIEAERVNELRKIFSKHIHFDSEQGMLIADPECLYYGKIMDGKIRITESFARELATLVPPCTKSSKDIDPLSPTDRPYANLAFVLQEMTEQVVTSVVRYYFETHPRTKGLRKLALAGGIALNILANGRILFVGLVKGEDIFVQPASSDAGTAIGAALVVAKEIYGQAVNFKMEHAFYGPDYSDEAIEKSLKSFGLQEGRDYHRADDVQLVEEAARCIQCREPIAWFQGRSEIGPRALGNRSILLNILDDAANNSANIIKGRQSWRPSASSVAAEYAADYFIGIGESPFMIVAFDVWPGRKNTMASGVHQYGKRLARPQTVDKNVHPLYWALLQKVGEYIGVPAVVNTSFNKSEPLVESPEEALNTYKYMLRVNKLFLGHFIIHNKEHIQSTIASLQDEARVKELLSQAVSSGDINDWDVLFDRASLLYPSSHRIIVQLDADKRGAKVISFPLVKELFEAPLSGMILRYISSVIYNHTVDFKVQKISIGSSSEKMKEVVFSLIRRELEQNFKRMKYFANHGKAVGIVPLTATERVLQATGDVLLKPSTADECKGVYVGIDIGASKIKGVLLRDGQPITQRIIDTTFAGGSELKNLVVGLVRNLTEGLAVEGIGISIPGVTSEDGSQVEWLVNYEYKWPQQGAANYTAQYEAFNSVIGALRGEYGIANVGFLNDATAFGVASLNLENVQNAVLLVLGTGAGVARVKEGKVNISKIEQSSGFVINVGQDAPFDEGCSVKGCFAAYVGAAGLLTLSKKLGLEGMLGKQGITMLDISELLRNESGPGYAEAKRVYAELAKRIISWIKLMHRMYGDTSFILVGGTSAGYAGGEIINKLNGSIKEEGITVSLSGLDREYAGAIGSAFFAVGRWNRTGESGAKGGESEGGKVFNQLMPHSPLVERGETDGNYPASMPVSNGPDRTPTADEQAKIFKALGGQDAGVFQGRDVVIVMRPSLQAPVRTETIGGRLHLLVNPNILRGPPEQIEIIFRGHELFHILGQPEAQARQSTIRYLIDNNLLESHIAFLLHNDLYLKPDEDWLKSLLSIVRENANLPNSRVQASES